MAVVNLAAELDEIGVQLDQTTTPPPSVPKILIIQPTIDLSDGYPPSRSASFQLSKPPEIPEISTQISVENPNVVVITPRSEPQLERPTRRRFVNGFATAASKFGTALEFLGVKSAQISLARKAHRLLLGGLFAERLPNVTCCPEKRVGPENQFRLRIYYPKPTTLDSAQRHPVIFYIHGNLAFSRARSYHSFLANLTKDLLDTSAIVVAFNYANVPERRLSQLLDDCVNLVEAILLGELDSDFEMMAGLKLEHERVVLAGDSAGALLAFVVALELAHRQDFDRPELHGLAMISPPLQALTTHMFESHMKFNAINCESLSHRLDLLLPLYVGLEAKNELKLARSAIQAERHVATDLKSRLLRRIFPTYEGPPGGSGNNNVEPTGIFQEISQLASSARIWPMLMKNKELALLPDCLMQACEEDVLFDEQRLFAKRMHKVLGYKFRFSVIPNAVHNEAVNVRLLDSRSARQANREIVEFLRETIAKPPIGPEMAVYNNSNNNSSSSSSQNNNNNNNKVENTPLPEGIEL